MLATSGPLPTGDDWAYEIKWDGIRALAYIAPDFLRLVTRNGNDVTRRYPELQGLRDAIVPEMLPVVLDGEIVAMDDNGIPDFSRLQRRMNLTSDPEIALRTSEVPVYYAIFDLLVQDGNLVTSREYAIRRALLQGMNLHDRHWSVPRGFDNGEKLLEESTARGMEGVIAKMLSGTYTPGKRSGTWIKTKHRPRQEFVIGGWTVGAGVRASSFGSILVGARRDPEEPALHYFGNVGSGFNDVQLSDLQRQFVELERSQSPFDDDGVDRKLHGVRWVKPCIVAEVEYQQLTNEGRLRHPVFKGLRYDKDAREVVYEGRWPAGSPPVPDASDDTHEEG